MTIRDNRDCIRVLLYCYYTTITGWGVLLIKISEHGALRQMGCAVGSLEFYSLQEDNRDPFFRMSKRSILGNWGGVGSRTIRVFSHLF